MRARALFLRLVTLGLAFVHTFPARHHLANFVEAPSLGEAWKGAGALVAITLYLLPSSVQARGLAALWRRRRVVFRVGGAALAIAHLVPAADHLPAFFAAPSWGDAWRGFGSLAAALWFIAPLPLQARLVARLAWRATPPPAPPQRWGGEMAVPREEGMHS